MPVETWALLETRPGEVWLDDCATVHRALHTPPSQHAKHAAAAAAAAEGAAANVGHGASGTHGSTGDGGSNRLGGLGGLWVHHGAYLFARPPYRAVSLLLQRGHGAALGPGDAKPGGGTVALPPPSPRRSDTLVAVTCAGVWPRTLSALLSLEAAGAHAARTGGSGRRLLGGRSDPSGREGGDGERAFDLMLAVTPRGEDASAAAAAAAGIPALVQAVVTEGVSHGTKGLTDLWNTVVKHCLKEGYKHCFIANNDILVGSATVSVLVSALESGFADLVLPLTRRGAGTGDLEQYGDDSTALARNDFLDSPLSWQRLQLGLLPKRQSNHVAAAQGATSETHTATLRGGHRRRRRLKGSKLHDGIIDKANLVARPAKGWMAFFFGMNAAWARASLLPDGSGRLWNDTRWKNYAQEKNLPSTTRIVAARQAYAHHFRGGTLDSASCKNGWLDCAVWQVHHRPDMASEWFKPNEQGL
jgi:hypothetical protein